MKILQLLHKILFYISTAQDSSQKIKVRFKLESTISKVSTLIRADVSGFMVWLTHVGTYKIDGFIFKPFNMT